jgi:hypothetical protein
VKKASGSVSRLTAGRVAQATDVREGGLRTAGIRTTLLGSLTSAFRVDAGAGVETPVKWR